MPITVLGGTKLADTGFNVDNSLRFNRADSPYLSRTQSTSPTHDDKCTMSFWFKQGSQAATASRGFSFGGSDDTSNRSHFYIETDGQLYSYGKLSNSVHLTMNSTRMLRDSGAWYHYCLAVDTTQSTAANRVREYINNVEITDYEEATYPNQNDNFPLVKGSRMLIGAIRGGSDQIYNHSECYLAEVHFIDGQQLTPASFAEYDEDSPTIWKPKDCKADLTYGTNGFYLEFKGTGTSADANGIGADTSGNDNHFTVTNLAAADQAVDSPTNNFCVLDVNNPTYTGTNSQGNCKHASSSSSWRAIYGTIPFTTGKWYAEFKVVDKGSSSGPGVINIDMATGVDTFRLNETNRGVGQGENSVAYLDNNQILDGGTTIKHGQTTFTDGDILGVAIDATNGFIYWSKGGTFMDGAKTGTTVGDPTSGSSGDGGYPLADLVSANGTYLFGYGGDDSQDIEANFGGCSAFAVSSGNADANGYGNFEYSVPSGYYALCTKNLAEFG